jgi:hypothetical protein
LRLWNNAIDEIARTQGLSRSDAITEAMEISSARAHLNKGKSMKFSPLLIKAGPHGWKGQPDPLRWAIILMMTLIASAARTLDAEASGISALSAGIHDGLDQTFTGAADLIRNRAAGCPSPGWGSRVMLAAKSRPPWHRPAPLPFCSWRRSEPW